MLAASPEMDPLWCTMQDDSSHVEIGNLERALHEAARFSRDFPGPNTPIVIDGIGILYATVALYPAFFAHHGLTTEAIESYMRNFPLARVPDSNEQQYTAPVSAARRLASERYGTPPDAISSDTPDPQLAALLYHLLVPSVNLQGRPLPHARSLDTMLSALRVPVGHISTDLQRALPSEKVVGVAVHPSMSDHPDGLAVASASSNGHTFLGRIVTVCMKYLSRLYSATD